MPVVKPGKSKSYEKNILFNSIFRTVIRLWAI